MNKKIFANLFNLINACIASLRLVLIFYCLFTKKGKNIGDSDRIGSQSVTYSWVSRAFLSKIPGGRWCNFISDRYL